MIQDTVIVPTGCSTTGSSSNTLRRNVHGALNENEATEDDDGRLQTAVAQNALDYILHGHFVVWDGDFDESIRCYQSALRIDPGSYGALYFLPSRLTSRVDRNSEAIVYYEESRL